jgi:hypothetical protein
MQKKIYATASMILLAAAIWLPSNGLEFQERRDNPSSINDYDLVARGKFSQGRDSRPEQIARMDNNGEILFACLEAKTSDQLESSGIDFLQSQLELLVDWNLLEYDRKNKTFKTTIHVYGIEKASDIRHKVNEAVNELADGLADDIESLKNHLQSTGREKSLFAIFYAYILHSYAMQQLGEEIYQTPQLSENNPFWKGYAWAIYPKKKFDTGVISVPADGNQFYIVVSPSLPKIDFSLIRAFIKDMATDFRVDDPELKKSFSAYDLLDDEGNLTILIIDEGWSEKLRAMAKKVYARTIALADNEEMKDILGMETQAQAAMFLHYEIRFAFLQYVLEKGIVPAPLDFGSSAKNEASDFSNLVFLMRIQR